MTRKLLETIALHYIYGPVLTQYTFIKTLGTVII